MNRKFSGRAASLRRVSSAVLALALGAGLAHPAFAADAAAADAATADVAAADSAGLTDIIAREGSVSLSVFAHRRVLLPLLGMAVLALAPVVLSQLRRLGAARREAARARNAAPD